MAISFYRSFGTPVTIVRPFNTYGPRQSARAVIPSIITQLATGKKQIQLGALHPTRDFNFVEDTVAGFIAALEAKAPIAGETINLASRFEISIERLFGDNEKAKRLLDWEPAYGGREGFARGLKKTIEWFRSPENLRLYKADRYNV
jgi:dTDP-glucose 4,6-dehydratase